MLLEMRAGRGSPGGWGECWRPSPQSSSGLDCSCGGSPGPSNQGDAWTSGSRDRRPCPAGLPGEQTDPHPRARIRPSRGALEGGAQALAPVGTSGKLGRSLTPSPWAEHSHAHIPLHPDARWEQRGQPQPGPDGSHPPGAVSPGAKAGSGQDHGGGSGVCGPQRWHSPAPARPGPLGLPGGPLLPSQAVAGGLGAAWAGNVSSKEGSGMHAQPLAARPGHARRREGSAGLLPNQGSTLSPHGCSPPLPPPAPGASDTGVCIGFQPNPGMCLLAAQQLFLELGRQSTACLGVGADGPSPPSATHE